MRSPAFLLPLLLPLLVAAGAPPSPLVTEPEDTSLERYVHDLDHPFKAQRRYAARVLRSRLRGALRELERGREDSLEYDEARATLEDFHELVLPACIEAIERPETAVPCADVLGLLGDERAVEPLERLLQSGPPRRLERHAERALEALGVDPSEGS